jgi:hypothetical protein
MRFHGIVLLCAVAIVTTSAGCCKDEEKTVAPAASTPVPVATATTTATVKVPQPLNTRRYDAGSYVPEAGSVFGGPPPIVTGKHTTKTPPTTQPPPTSTTFGTPPGLR